MNLYLISAFALYTLCLVGIGFFGYYKNKKSADFALGGRSLGYWVTALAAHASDMSGWLFMAFPATIYAGGLVGAWTAISLTAFMYLNWKFIAPRVRVATEQHKSLTLSSFFEAVSHDKTGYVRITSALLCLFFFTFYISANLAALGLLFESVFGIDYVIGIIIGFFVIFYVLLGGFVSISWIDFCQGIFLLGVIILVPLVACMHVGGVSAIIATAAAKNVSLTILPECSWLGMQEILTSLVWGLGYFGQPHIITKFMGIKNVHEMKKAQIIGLSWQVLALSGALCVGLVGIAFFPHGLVDNQFIFIEMVKALFHPFFVGLILCAVLATAINVIGAQVLVSASVLAEDFYRKIIPVAQVNKEKRIALVSRLSVAVICFIASLIAYCNASVNINALVFYAWTGLGCTFGPLLIVSLYRRSVHYLAALTGILCGGLIAAVWPYCCASIPAMLPGFFLGLSSILIVDKLLTCCNTKNA